MSGACVFIKPTGVECGADSYDIRRGLFRPRPGTIRTACADWLRLDGPALEDTINRAEQLAATLNLNILGGLFLVGVERIGMSHQHVARVHMSDLGFVGVLYPDLATGKAADESSPKVRNNLGTYSVHRIESTEATDVHEALARLKLTFRNSLASHLDMVVIPDCGDHVVHVPDDPAQELLHLTAAGVAVGARR